MPSGKIIFCLASVITEKARFVRFLQLLQSIRDQEQKPAGLCISIHLSPALGITREQLQNYCRKLTCRSNNTRILWQNDAHSQFVGYQHLLRLLPGWFADPDNNNSTLPLWVGFTDDDDLWSRGRVACYTHMLEELYSNEKRAVTSALCITQKTWQVRADCCQIEKASDVVPALQCGCVRTKCHDAETETTEYVNLVVPLARMKEFCEEYAYYIEHSRYCDVVFFDFARYYTRNGQTNTVTCQSDKIGDWAYFYRYSGSEYASATLPYSCITWENLEYEAQRWVELLEVPRHEKSHESQWKPRFVKLVENIRDHGPPGMFSMFIRSFAKHLTERTKLAATYKVKLPNTMKYYAHFWRKITAESKKC